ncbi:MAG TPA: HD domain-containing protein [Ktedonobacteraceae bacterium]|jgi:HD superfamily phosphodiesterase|nr:HD domain-containing protein [Ktedonobacteraceae bacterium]
MEREVVRAAADYAEETLDREGFQYVSAVVANCKMLAVELEEQGEDTGALDMEALILAAYLHNISTAAHGFHDHHLASAEMAVDFLRELDVPPQRISRVEQAILAHTTAIPPEQRDAVLLEGRILYDADMLGRLSGLAVVTSLIEFGTRYPNHTLTSEVLVAMLRHIEERFVELYQSLNTAPARERAREKFSNTLAFLDGIIEYLGDATPV